MRVKEVDKHVNFKGGVSVEGRPGSQETRLLDPESHMRRSVRRMLAHVMLDQDNSQQVTVNAVFRVPEIRCLSGPGLREDIDESRKKDALT